MLSTRTKRKWMCEDGLNRPFTHPENCHFNSDIKLQIFNLQKIASRADKKKYKPTCDNPDSAELFSANS